MEVEPDGGEAQREDEGIGTRTAAWLPSVRSFSSIFKTLRAAERKRVAAGPLSPPPPS